MKKALLVTRPNYDDGTSYLYSYAKQVIDFAQEKNIKVFDLVRPRLRRKYFSEILNSQDPSLVFFNAHGDAKTIYGDKISGSEESLVQEGDVSLTGRIIYARACFAAQSLGHSCGAGCFIGYTVPFSFWIDSQWSSKPLCDPIARLFLEPSNLIVVSLLKGNTAEEASDKSLQLSKKNILQLLKKPSEPHAMACIMLLWNNMSGQEIIGDSSMRF